MVMYAPFILPSTCILPSQKERIENKKREKRAAYAAEMAPAFEEVRRRALADPAANARALLAGQGMDAIGGYVPRLCDALHLSDHPALTPVTVCLVIRRTFPARCVSDKSNDTCSG